MDTHFTIADGHRFSEICKLLEAEYGVPDPSNPPLGNVLNPLDELVYIMLTTMTEYGAQDAFNRIKENFKNWEDVLTVPKEKFFYFLKPLGLVNQRGNRLIEIFSSLKENFGAVTLDPLKNMSTKEAEEFLTSLPGVGIKIARCVLLYSLNREVFPVDTHVLRLCRRLGLISPSISWQKSHDILQNAITPKDRYSLHVNLVLHGKKVCKAKRPKCEECILTRNCAKLT